MKLRVPKLTIQPILAMFLTPIIVYLNTYSAVYSSETNKRIEYDVEKRYFIDDQINLRYDIKSLGLKIAKLDFEVNFGEAKYFSNATVQTQGIGDLFSNSIWTFSSRGVLSKNDIQPKFYNNHIETKKGVGHVSIVYRNGKHNILARPEIKENKLIRLYEQLNAQTIDPISSMIEMSMYHSKDVCTGEWEVTDGRRIFSIQFEQIQEENICSAKFIPLVGFSDKEMKKYEDNPVPLFILELMKITIKDEFIFLIPISINAREGISGSINLVELTINGKPVVF
tara:strand:- start:160 stop:1005 length:846 start_codon:yes stop_codon:yes gene_type:complete